MSNRFPWAEATTAERFKERLARSRGRMLITLKSGEEATAVAYHYGVVHLDVGKVRLSNLVWTPFGYEEIESQETDIEKRAIEALAQMERRIDIAELDAPRDPLALLSKRLAEEAAAQQKAGTTEFQTLDPLTEKVIVSWLRDLSDGDMDPWRIAAMIEAGEHRKP